jgi:ribosome-binding factor A
MRGKRQLRRHRKVSDVPPTQRQERINQLLVSEISTILRRDVEDPHIGFVTLTGADVTVDLRYAKVFFSVMGTPEQVVEATRALRRAKRFIRKGLADHLEMRRVPELDFRLDSTAEHAQRIETLLAEVAKEREELGEVPGVDDDDEV